MNDFQCSESLFHYTDINAVSSILKNRKLWLTNIGYLNDSQEFRDGVSIFSVHVIEAMKSASGERSDLLGKLYQVMQAFESVADSTNIFTCSFSRAPNLLSQWRAYGNFAIELDSERISSSLPLYKCMYDAEEKNSACAWLENYFITEYPHSAFGGHNAMQVLARVLTVLTSFKNFHFSAEQEVRMIAQSDSSNANVLYRVKGDYLVPYVEVNIPVDAVKAIHVGPIANQGLASRSLESFMGTIGLSEVRVVNSDIPYRA